MICSPTETVSESPILAISYSLGIQYSFNNATYATGADLITLARISSPFKNLTVMFSALSTIWAAVKISPFFEIRTPEPMLSSFTNCWSSLWN